MSYDCACDASSPFPFWTDVFHRIYLRDELKKTALRFTPTWLLGGFVSFADAVCVPALSNVTPPSFSVGLAHPLLHTNKTNQEAHIIHALPPFVATPTVFFSPPRVLRFLLLHFFPHTVFLSLSPSASLST